MVLFPIHSSPCDCSYIPMSLLSQRSIKLLIAEYPHPILNQLLASQNPTPAWLLQTLLYSLTVCSSSSPTYTLHIHFLFYSQPLDHEAKPLMLNTGQRGDVNEWWDQLRSPANWRAHAFSKEGSYYSAPMGGCWGRTAVIAATSTYYYVQSGFQTWTFNSDTHTTTLCKPKEKHW